jgi:acetyl-CoA carboxylase biotin carboxylase subunit
MGEKDRARREMEKAGLPVVPGSDGVIKSVEEGLEDAGRIGYPVLIKAAAGGGGRGMRIVNDPKDFADAFAAAQNEAAQAFGIGDVYVEKSIERPRHVEFQVLGDRHGKVIHLGERECSIQRRHQKLLEESPSPIMDAKLRAELGEAVARAIQGLGYCNAGTVEFVVDENRNFYFIEMNTRIQVEHPVTEMVTGIDLVKAQIQIAAGERVEDVTAGETEIRGHAIECRINAENPETFIPCAGRISALHTPGGTGVRVDTAAYADCVIPPYYDSLIAKLIVRGKDRKEATMRMARALEMFIVEGVETTIPLHRKILADPDFLDGDYDTDFLQRWSASALVARQ